MSLSCTVNDESFEAGETIKVKVKVDIKDQNDIEAVSGGFLRVDIKGEEYACVRWTDKTAEDHFERQTHTLLEYGEILTTFPTEIASEGHFEYPFEFELPDELPSSLSVSSGHSDCAIRYSMEATLKAEGRKGEDKIWNFPFVVHARPRPPRDEYSERYLIPNQQDISFCCFFDRGSMTLGGVLSKCVASQHDAVTVGIVASNNSLARVTNVELCLFQTTSFEALRKKESKREILAKQTFGSGLSGVGKVKNIKKILPEKEIERLLNILSDSKADKLEITIVLRPDFDETYIGTRIRVRHSLTILLQTAKSVTNPELKTFIKILPCGKILKESRSSEKTSFYLGDSKKYEANLLNDENKVIVAEKKELFFNPKKAEIVVGKSSRNSKVGKISFTKEFPISFEGLVEGINETFEVLALIEKYLEDETLGYKNILENLTANQFGTVVGRVNFIHDQSHVARLLQELLGSKCTCEYIACACRMSPESSRVEIARATGRKAVDFDQNRSLIEASLSKMDMILLTKCDW